MSENFYKSKKVFITGVTGFKGGWLSLWLHSLGADILGYSLLPDSNPSMFSAVNLEKKINFVEGNILNYEKLEKTIFDFSPDIIFHLAAQPLVRLSYKEPILTYQTNVIGTLNLLEAAKNAGCVKAFVNVTTDKCYENKEKENYAYCENDSMGGFDMYSSSKACSELLCSSYRRSFLQENGFALATARAGNVIGGGDWAVDRLICDCVRAIYKNELIQIRNPKAIRPWQFVLDPLYGYLILAEKLFCEGQKYAQGFNFGPQCQNNSNVFDVSSKFCELMNFLQLELACNLQEVPEAQF